MPNTITKSPSLAPLHHDNTSGGSSIVTLDTLNPQAKQDAGRWLSAPLTQLPALQTEQDYDAALFAVDQIMDARANTAKLERLIALTALVTRYEEAHFPL